MSKGWKIFLAFILIPIIFFLTPLILVMLGLLNPISPSKFVILIFAFFTFAIKFCIRIGEKSVNFHKQGFDYSIIGLGFSFSSISNQLLYVQPVNNNFTSLVNIFLSSLVPLRENQNLFLYTFLLCISIIISIVTFQIMESIDINPEKPEYLLKFINFIIGIIPFMVYMFLLLGN